MVRDKIRKIHLRWYEYGIRRLIDVVVRQVIINTSDVRDRMI